MTDPELYRLAERVGAALLARHLTLACAESCTGGAISAAVTDVPGSSAWFERGFVTYANTAKVELLGVHERTLAVHGAVSEPTLREMLAGALRCSGAGMCVAVTGIAGPGGAVPGKPVGSVWHGWVLRGEAPECRLMVHEGDRWEVRRAAVRTVLEGICERLGAGYAPD